MGRAQPKLPTSMTADEFLAWPGDGVGGRYQLVDGELRAMLPASATHVIIQLTFGRLIANHLDVPGNPCHAAVEPAIAVKIRARENIRVPDIGVSCAPDAAGQIALPDPIVLVEIMSPGNRQDTRANVWAYTTIPSLREIVIVQSTRIEAEVLRRGADGHWPADASVVGDGESLELASIALSVLLRALYAKTHLA